MTAGTPRQLVTTAAMPGCPATAVPPGGAEAATGSAGHGRPGGRLHPQHDGPAKRVLRGVVIAEADRTVTAGPDGPARTGAMSRAAEVARWTREDSGERGPCSGGCCSDDRKVACEQVIELAKGARCRVEKVAAVYTSKDAAISEPAAAARQAAAGTLPARRQRAQPGLHCSRQADSADLPPLCPAVVQHGRACRYIYHAGVGYC